METKRSPLITVNYDSLPDAHGCLREHSALVDPGDNRIPDIVETMRRVFYELPHAHGISAIQIGIPLRIALINIKRRSETEILVVNPELTRISGRPTARSEGCLSLSGYKATVIRRNKVMLEGLNLDGTAFTYIAIGYEAAVIQHEIDHLNGICFWDRATTALVPTPLKPNE